MAGSRLARDVQHHRDGSRGTTPAVVAKFSSSPEPCGGAVEMDAVIRPLKKAVKRSPLWPVLRPRRLHAYNLGAGRTGTVASHPVSSA